jgi:hypothetical protein
MDDLDLLSNLFQMIPINDQDLISDLAAYLRDVVLACQDKTLLDPFNGFHVDAGNLPHT